MGVHSGKWGVVDGVSMVKQWSVTDAQATVRSGMSNLKWGKGTWRGVESWNGSFQSVDPYPVIMPGQSFTFLGYTAPSDDSSGAGITYGGTALVKQVQFNWNWGNNELINQQVDFDGHLAPTITAAGSQIFDEEPVLPKSPACTKITYSSDLSTWTEWTDLVTAQLTFTADNKSYVNSTTVITDSGVCRIWTGQKSGAIDWTLAVTEQNTDRARFKKGDALGVRIYINATEYFELVYGRVKEFTGLVVNTDTNEILQQTVNLEMHGVKDADGSLGHIKLPDLSTFWPEAAES